LHGHIKTYKPTNFIFSMERTYIKDLKSGEIVIQGWVSEIRNLSKLKFILVRDSTGIVQCIIKDDKLIERFSEISLESVVEIFGKVKEANVKEKNTRSDIEIEVSDFKVMNKAVAIPVNPESKEDTRLKYRYLDIRLNEKLRNNLLMRHKVLNYIRNHLDSKDFTEIQTPVLTKSSPEGARDFIVPSRIHPGKFYALPQAPQQYKQLLMVAGIPRYFQIAPCFRDEDSRADRSPGEFYQLDLEMAFPKQDDILNVIEDTIINLVKELFPEKKVTQIPFPRFSYKEAMEKYGCDKPDIRKNKEDKNELGFCWVVNFPLFEEEKENGKFAPMHNMFTMPKEEDCKFLNENDAHKVFGYQHDLALNGFEIGGGAIRIHKPEIQEKIFDLIGFKEEEKRYFSHMLEAFTYGAPPHGGIALGIERLVMILLGEPNIREVTAFPKNKEGKELTLGAPDTILKEQLDEVGLEFKK